MRLGSRQLQNSVQEEHGKDHSSVSLHDDRAICLTLSSSQHGGLYGVQLGRHSPVSESITQMRSGVHASTTPSTSLVPLLSSS